MPRFKSTFPFIERRKTRRRTLVYQHLLPSNGATQGGTRSLSTSPNHSEGDVTQSVLPPSSISADELRPQSLQHSTFPNNPTSSRPSSLSNTAKHKPSTEKDGSELVSTHSPADESQPYRVLSTLGKIGRIGLRIGAIAADSFPPAKGVIGGVIEVLSIYDVRRQSV